MRHSMARKRVISYKLRDNWDIVRKYDPGRHVYLNEIEESALLFIKKTASPNYPSLLIAFKIHHSKTWETVKDKDEML